MKEGTSTWEMIEEGNFQRISSRVYNAKVLCSLGTCRELLTWEGLHVRGANPEASARAQNRAWKPATQQAVGISSRDISSNGRY